MPVIPQALIKAALLAAIIVALNSVIVASMWKTQKEKARPPSVRGSPLISRRSLLWMPVEWNAFCASTLTMVAATGRFMFPNVLFEPPSTFKAGFPREIQSGHVATRFKEDFGICLVHDAVPTSGEDVIGASLGYGRAAKRTIAKFYMLAGAPRAHEI